MSILSIILIILFFVVLACKPTYLMFEGTNEEGKTGTFFCRAPWCMAMYLKIILKAEADADVIFVGSAFYNKSLELYNQYHSED